AWFYGKTGLAVGFAMAWASALFGNGQASAGVKGLSSFAKPWKLLVRTGVPITAAGTIFLFVISIDRVIVARTFDIRTAGVYGLASVAASSVVVFQQALGALFLPRLSLARAGGASESELRATAARLSTIVLRLSLLFVVAFAVGFPLLVTLLLRQ